MYYTSKRICIGMELFYIIWLRNVLRIDKRLTKHLKDGKVLRNNEYIILQNIDWDGKDLAHIFQSLTI